MFYHNFKYALKTLFRDKMLIFWTFAFPIILGTFFNMAFSNIENSEKLDIIKIAVVEDEQWEGKEALATLGDAQKEERLFDITYTKTEEEAKELLQQDKVTGYIVGKEETPKVVVTTSGINETIIKQVVEEITQTTKIVNDLAQEQIKQEMLAGQVDYEKIYENVWEMTKNQEAKLEDVSSKHLSYTMIEFYTLIAMTCLYGGILAMVAINQNLPNMSHNGKRVSIAPTPKGKVILSSVLAGYVTQLIGLALLFVYTIVVLKVDYGTNMPLIVLLAMVGSLAGLSMGLAIATLFKTNENVKTGIMISVTMLGCFLSGMMGVTMKYIIDKNIPILNQLNPANMITDGFYALYYYDTFHRYYFNVVSLLVFAFIMIAISYFSLRRQKYDSI